MKSEEEIRLLRAELDRQARQTERDCSDFGIMDRIEVELIKSKVHILDEILETKDNSFYG